jgi:tungstate transport system substrate-binding protein
LPVNPANHPHVDGKATNRLEDWFASDTAKGLIDGYRVEGQQVFHFNAQPKSTD